VSFALLKKDVALFATTAFILSFTIIGFIQIPLQIGFFGKRFVIIQNI
jgi:NADH:ubiquinone oxidoreductase subunit 2 (subunit N)